MTPSACALESAATSLSVGNGLNHRSRTRPTFLPLARISRIATLIGREMVPIPTRITSASSVMYSSNHGRSEEHTSELQSRLHLVCRLLLEKKKNKKHNIITQITKY